MSMSGFTSGSDLHFPHFCSFPPKLAHVVKAVQVCYVHIPSTEHTGVENGWLYKKTPSPLTGHIRDTQRYWTITAAPVDLSVPPLSRQQDIRGSVPLTWQRWGEKFNLAKRGDINGLTLHTSDLPPINRASPQDVPWGHIQRYRRIF